jgi:hypothetical protein
MTKKPIDQTDAPASSSDETTEGAQKLKLSVKRMKKLRSSVKGGANATDPSWTTNCPDSGNSGPGPGPGWTNNAEVALV